VIITDDAGGWTSKAYPDRPPFSFPEGDYRTKINDVPGLDPIRGFSVVADPE
jgi:hypothetical protein